MPWCSGCDRFLSPNTVLADGTCPTCHATIADTPHAHPAARAGGNGSGNGSGSGSAGTGSEPAPAADGPTTALDPTQVAPGDDDRRPPIPWHLWVLIAALVVYLGYRAFQGLELLFGF